MTKDKDVLDGFRQLDEALRKKPVGLVKTDTGEVRIERVDDNGGSHEKHPMMCAVVNGPLMMPDNETGPCNDCGTLLQYRPYNRGHTPKLCMECAMTRLDGGNG